MQFLPTEWFILTPEGTLKAFAQQNPDDDDTALQTLLAEGHTPDAASWVAADPRRAELAQRALLQGSPQLRQLNGRASEWRQSRRPRRPTHGRFRRRSGEYAP